MTSQTVHSVCPLPEDLAVKGVVTCPVEGCGHRFPSSSHLQMHIVRHHQGRALESKSRREAAVFYCPAEGCERSEGKGRPFPRLGQLKQHYNAVHGKKNYVCQRCGKNFGLRDVCQRHESECGQVFSCTTCSESFRSRNALYQHAKRKKHALPNGSHPRPKSSSRHPHPYQPVSPIVLPSVVIRPVVAITSSTISRSTQTRTQQAQSVAFRDASVQTDCSPEVWRTSVGMVVSPDYVSWDVYTNSGWDHIATTGNGLSACECSSSMNLATQTEVSDLASHFLSLGTQTEVISDPANLLLSLGTQTEVISDPANHLLSLGTQTEVISDPANLLLSLGTQTEVISDPANILLSLGTQTEVISDPANHLLSLGTPTEINNPASHLMTLGTQTAEALTSSQSCQTQGASSCEFGTQTYSDFAAQYLLHNPSSVVDFGTQTAASEQACSLGTGQEALHDDLCLDDQTFCLLPPECMEFGTQTLDEFPCFHDLGVQTLLPAETKDQGSQTPGTVLQYKTNAYSTS